MNRAIFKIGFVSCVLSVHLNFFNTSYQQEVKTRSKQPKIRGKLFYMPIDTVEVIKYNFESWCPLVERRPLIIKEN